MEKKQEIIKILKEKGKLPTSRIGAIIGVNNQKVKELLEELKQEKKVKELKETLATYWVLK